MEDLNRAVLTWWLGEVGIRVTRVIIDDAALELAQDLAFQTPTLFSRVNVIIGNICFDDLVVKVDHGVS